MSINWDEVLKIIGSSAVVVGVLGYFMKSAFAHFLAADLETHKAQLKSAADSALKVQEAELKLKTDRHLADLTAKNQTELERLKAGIATGTARAERVRQEIERWANPISGAVDDLKARLFNIRQLGGHTGLSPGGAPPAGWKIGYDYFLPSTVFIFAQYFCWIRLLQESLTFELFPQAEKDEFLKRVRAVGHPLSTWPMEGPPVDAEPEDDAQIFALQQRAIGDSMIVPDAGGVRCMRAGAFLDSWSDAAFRAKFQPLVAFLDGLTPDRALRWERLARMDVALEDLSELCRNILAPAPGAPA